MFGVTVDPHNLAGSPDPAALRDLGLSWVRMVALPSLEPYIARCRNAGLRVLLVIARESVAVASVASYAARYRPDAWAVGNEPDLVSPSSWSMTAEQYSLLWREALPLLRRQGVPIVTAGLASGQPGWIEPIVGQLHGCHAVAVHPYAKTAEEARSLIREYRRVTRLPVWATEWNRPAGEIAGFVAMLRQEAEVACWFCATNGMVPGFGLLDVPEKLTAMKEAIMNVNIPELDGIQDRVELLEKQQALTVAVLKLILQGRWSGDLPNAEAVLKAINPNDTDWQAVPFVRG